MELELTADQRNFREATQSFLGDRYPTAEIRALRHDPDGFDRDYWRQGAELGWTSLLASEKDGGGTISGRSVCDLTLVAFEFGRFAAPGPLTATNMVVAALGTVGHRRAEGRTSAEPAGRVADRKLGLGRAGPARPARRGGARGDPKRRRLRAQRTQVTGRVGRRFRPAPGDGKGRRRADPVPRADRDRRRQRYAR